MCIKVCNSSFESAILKNVTYLYAKIYIITIQRIFFLNNVARERETTTFKSYDTQLHIQIIYCQLIGHCPVVLSPSCPVDKLAVAQLPLSSIINSLILWASTLMHWKCATVILTVLLWGVPLICMFKRLGHIVKCWLYCTWVWETRNCYEFKCR